MLPSKPHGIALTLLRLPALLYRAHLGWLLGRRFLLLSHRGRRSGRVYHTPLEVLRWDPERQEATVVSAWGEATEWYRNLRVAPAVDVQTGSRHCHPEPRFLSTDELADLLVEFRHRHPLEARLAPRLLGWPLMGSDSDLRTLASRLRAVAFRVP